MLVVASYLGLLASTTIGGRRAPAAAQPAEYNPPAAQRFALAWNEDP